MKIKSITVATILAGSTIFVGCEKENLHQSSKVQTATITIDENLSNLSKTTYGELVDVDTIGILNQKDIVGKKTAEMIKEVRTNLDLDIYQSNLTEISAMIDNEADEEHIANQEDATMLLPLIENLTESTFEGYTSISESIEENISNNQEFSMSRKNYLLKRISRLEWLKYGLEINVEEQGNPDLCKGNPDPGGSTYDNYIDYCMENFINENFTWANWVERAGFIVASPEILLWGMASCTETYITN